MLAVIAIGGIDRKCLFKKVDGFPNYMEIYLMDLILAVLKLPTPTFLAVWYYSSCSFWFIVFREHLPFVDIPSDVREWSFED